MFLRVLSSVSKAFFHPISPGRRLPPNTAGYHASLTFAALLGVVGPVACSSTEVASTSAAASSVTLAVEGMTCGDCEQAITAAVSKLPGVARCTASHVEKSTIVELAPGATTSPAAIAETVRNLGYTVTLTSPAPLQAPASH